ncbi:exodeoxyribonuclease VII small subunit [Pseudohalioglobus sediminis]|uniref:Exodeoxyribonuclease 7 small subunit n=1 Tax=Pseudohalioglobus sediminis TaxID=2606449 RepID=A0A5B0WP56_9GAMM|nr:exodeoxyribonuclease VII small subunit [Pseudohalioglobus sediminis]KAA1188840.1 exodeoxyribonuclease VII small subunit [Pseudohalioglobus sediminis]
MAGKKKSHDFSALISELEGLVTEIEDESRSLDDALRTFESGITLVRHAQKLLEEMEQKVQTLTAAGQAADTAALDDKDIE